MSYRFKVTIDEAGTRIDKFLSMKIRNLSRSSIQKLILDCNVLVNGKIINKKYNVLENDEISINIPEPTSIDAIPEDIPLDIVYEDEYLVVVNKPKGMVVHSGAGNFTGTLVNALLYHCKGNLSGINGKIRPGIVHRIDKNTSGLLVVAKNDVVHNHLSQQISDHTVTREYRAIVHGKFKEISGKITTFIGRNPKERIKMAVVSSGGKLAITNYEVLLESEKYSYMKLVLETGRTHQIRVHMAYKNHPIVNDDIYGRNLDKYDYEGQCLHAKTLGFVHPMTNKYMEFTSELPDYFVNTFNKTGFDNNL